MEFDGALAEALRTRFPSDGRVTIVRSDFLRFRLPDGPYKVLGNIPFNRTAAIVRRLVQADSPPQDAWLVVQREAAERFAGGPSARETLSSLLLKRDGRAIRRCLRAEFTRTQIQRLGRDLRFDPSGPPRGLTFDQWLGLFRFRSLTRS